MSAKDLSLDELTAFYRKMLLIRRFEEKVLGFFEVKEATKIFGTTHVCIGQEAVAVGTCATLTDEDYITSTHRGHGHFIAKGGEAKRVMAELFAKDTGYSKGRGGSQHMGDMRIGHLGSSGITSSGIPIATGAAFSIQYRGTDQVAVCFFGDGAANEGVFHECLNMASLWKLPVVFVCENNQYAMSVPYNKAFATETIAERAAAYNMPGEVVNGMDVLKVYDAVDVAVDRARQGEGPTLLEFHTYRFLGHSKSDQRIYRTKDEESEWLTKDPIALLRKQLTHAHGVSDEVWLSLDASVDQEVAEAIAFADESPWPDVNTLYNNLYA